MSEHTPGPWQWEDNYLAGTETDWKSIIWYTNEDDGIHARQPDRDLIEASPDLLAALEGMIELSTKDATAHETSSAIVSAVTAISKARGKA
jgi:hypothetical protein